MKFGVCGRFDLLSVAEKSGCDYLEPSVAELMSIDKDSYLELRRKVNDSPIKCEAFNVMLPAIHRVTGPDADYKKAVGYMKEALERMSGIGGKVVVFGSSGARKVPDGFDKEEAVTQLAEFLTMLEPHLVSHDIALAIEPLNPNECNIINTVSEAHDLANQVDGHLVCCLADWYHMALQNESTEGIWRAGSRLIHVHIANPVGRVFPKESDGQDYSRLKDALVEIGYSRRISIEGASDNIEAELSGSIAYLRSVFG